MSLLHDIDCDDIAMDSVIRLGRIPEVDDEKPRPILLRFLYEGQSASQVKKLEDEKIGPSREDIYPPGPHTKAEGMSAEISGRTQTKDIQWRNQLDYLEQEGSPAQRRITKANPRETVVRSMQLQDQETST